MEDNYKTKRTCLVCGTEISGRSDKVFCSHVCKNAYHNDRKSQLRNYKCRVVTSLNVNYRILDQLLGNHVDSLSLCDIESLGFRASLVTGYQKKGFQKSEFRCFDIKYCMNDTKIYNIKRMKKY